MATEWIVPQILTLFMYFKNPVSESMFLQMGYEMEFLPTEFLLQCGIKAERQQVQSNFMNQVIAFREMWQISVQIDRKTPVKCKHMPPCI